MIATRKRIEAALTVVFVALSIFIGLNVWQSNRAINQEHNRVDREIKCNTDLINVLRKRSDARIVVDLSTMSFLQAEVMFHELDSPERTNTVRDAAQKAADARANPDLWAPYPDCYLGTEK